jgi:hypothetical protein
LHLHVRASNGLQRSVEGLSRAGALASWIRNTMTEMNKAYSLAIAAFIEAGGTYPCNEPGGGGDIMAEGPFVKIACRKLKQYQWMPREGHFLDGTPKGAYTRSLTNKQNKGPLSRRQQKRKASEMGSALPQWPGPIDAPPLQGHSSTETIMITLRGHLQQFSTQHRMGRSLHQRGRSRTQLSTAAIRSKRELTN